MEKLKSMTLLEASELVKAIEETFDVDASVGGGMMMAAPMAGGAVGGGDAAAEPTEFDLVLPRPATQRPWKRAVESRSAIT